MTEIEQALYRTRKSPLEVFAEFGLQYDSEVEICLDQCTSCNLWEKRLRPDLDGNMVCDYCYRFYGA